jgi:hypothetical protein
MSWGPRVSALGAGLALVLLSGSAAAVAAPANDAFANAEPLSGASDSASGTNAEATRETCRKAKRRVKKAEKGLRRARRSGSKAKSRRAEKRLTRAKKAKGKACMGTPPASSAPISGKLNQNGYTVIALDDGGRAVTDQTANGAFKLKPTATEVTLHLRAPDGTYGGPIVLQQRGNPVKRANKSLKKAKRALRKTKARLKKARGQTKGGRARAVAKRRQEKARRALKRAKRRLKRVRRALKRARKLASGRKAILGIKAENGLGDVRLGDVRVNATAGYATAKLTTRQWRGWTDQKRVATATSGVPIGAGNVGLVAVAKLNGPSSDPDRDGVPNPLDVDDDGDLVLDNFDTTSATSSARVSAVAAQGDEPTVVVGHSVLNLDLPHTVNANAGSTSAEINGALRGSGSLLITHAGLGFLDALPNLPGTLPELDCAADPQAVPPRPGLSYCSAGGTGRLDPDPLDATKSDAVDPFPACCDPDGNGLGSLSLDTTTTGPFPVYSRWLRHGATSAQIHTGDILITRLRTRLGGEKEFPGVLTYVFATVPTLASYSDEAGNSGSIAYPVAPGGPGTIPPSGGDPNGLLVTDGPDADSDVEVTFNFWRPQRPAAPGEPGEWTDVGNLLYRAGAAFGPGIRCPQDAYEQISPDLAPQAPLRSGEFFNLADTIGDRAPAPGNTFSFKLNLTKCLDADQRSGTFDNPGDSTQISFEAIAASAQGLGGGDFAQTAFWLTRK